MWCITAARCAQRRGAALRDFAFTAGRLWDEGKNIATLDRAAACLGIPFQAAGPLVGPNGQRVALAHLHPLGAIDERTLADYLSARPVFVSAARYEPFGLAVLEAALAGCPLVLADIPTFRELWDGVGALRRSATTRWASRRRSSGSSAMHRSRLTRGDLARRRARRFAPRRMAGGMDRDLCTAARSRAPSGGGGVRIAYFTHSLASCWNHGNAHFLRGVLRELSARGHEVRALEPVGNWSLANLLADHGEAGLDA